MFLVKDWEMFYTDTIGRKDEFVVDQVSIDVANKRFVLDIGADGIVTDGYDEEMNEVGSNYVSRFVFDLIIEGLRQKGFKEVVWDVCYDDNDN